MGFHGSQRRFDWNFPANQAFDLPRALSAAPRCADGGARSEMRRTDSSSRRGGRQTACKPGSVPRRPGGWPFIWDSRRRLPLATHPDGGAETRLDAPAGNGGGPCRPYSVLLPVRLAVPRPLPAARCALTAPFHPCPARYRAVCFLWRCLGGRPRRALPGTVFPWSPDFPHPAGFPRWPGAAIRPSGPV